MQVLRRPGHTLVLLATLGAAVSAWASTRTAPVDIEKVAGQWLYVEDLTEGRADEDRGPRMSARFTLRVDDEEFAWVRPRGDEVVPLDGTVNEVDGGETKRRFSGGWKEGAFHFDAETIRKSDGSRVVLIHREFRPTDEGLLVLVDTGSGSGSLALYKHPDDIDMPKGIDASISDVDWLEGAWFGTRGSSTIDERWTPPKGGAMLGTNRTVKGDRMSAFEFLRIVEKGDGLVYVAQPGGGTATEFVLVEKDPTRVKFVNPKHDYPQRIVYEFNDDGDLTANIGFAKGGRGTTFVFGDEGD